VKRGFADRVKDGIRSVLGRRGYVIRDVGRGVSGVDLFHDTGVLLRDQAAPVLFDVGANIGQTTSAMLRAFPSSRIWAFEPSPATVATLRHAVSDESRVTVEALAFSNTAGERAFHVTAGHSVNDSLLAPTWKEEKTVVAVRTDTVDDYCRRDGIDAVGWLKIDTQGHDLDVLVGAQHMLTQRRIRLYSCEAMFSRIYEGQTTLRDLLAFADTVGYELVGFYEQTYRDTRLIYLDALFAGPRTP
jgi:FkbM family methyltransferase